MSLPKLGFLHGCLWLHEGQSMNQNQRLKKIDEGIHQAVRNAIARHKMLGQSIAVWQDGKVAIIPANKIKLAPVKRKSK